MFQLILKAYQEVAVMSALGHKQTYAVQKAMSALPSKADIGSALVHVRYGPIADIIELFDHLVGERKHCRRHSDADCFGCLEINCDAVTLYLTRRVLVGW